MAARTSLIPRARGRLHERLLTELTGVDVLYGWNGNVGATDVVIVGGLAQEDATRVFQNFGGPTQPQRQENFHLVVMVRATSTGCTAREAYERCYGHVAQIEAALVVDTTLGLEDEGVQLAYIDRMREAEEPTGEGWACGIDVHVNVQTLV